MFKGRKRFRIIATFLLVFSLIIPSAIQATPVDNWKPMAEEDVTAEDLFISEYVEGSSFNKAIELYNGTGATVDLSSYSVELYSNGNTSPQTTVNLSGTLADGDVYVIHHPQAHDDIKAQGDLSHMVANFNGDDAVVLKKNGVIIDVFGQVGARENWGTDVTLVRKSTITKGDSNPNDPFNPVLEWDAYARDTFSFLGFHEMDGKPDAPIETIKIGEARTQPLGSTVQVKGIVTAVLKNTVHIQDETAAIAIFPSSSVDATIGDEITVSGVLQEYRGLLQLTGTTIIEKTEQVGEPEPVVLTGAELNEENESKLAIVNNVSILSIQNEGNGWINFIASDGTEFIVRDETAELGLQVGVTYDSIIGIVQQFDTAYQILPRSKADIIEDATVVQPVMASPGSGSVPKGTEVRLSTYTKDAIIYYTVDGSDPVDNGQLYDGPIVLEDDTVIKAYAVKEGLSPSIVTEFSYLVYDPVEGIKIHHIQGEGHYSPLVGQYVENVKGVVTYIYELNGNHYFHMQTPDDDADDNPKTSEGIVIFTGRNKANVEVGDLVAVSGTVDEYTIDGYSDRFETDLPVTEINARDDQGGVIEVLEKNVELPTPFKITLENLPTEVIDNDSFGSFDPEEDAIDFWESLEGMLVEVGNLQAVAPQEHGDIITVLEGLETTTIHGGLLIGPNDFNPERIQFKLHPNQEARNFAVKTGDKFMGPIVGVVNYGYQNYKIYADLEDLQAAFVPEKRTRAERSLLRPGPGKLTIASYNLENFSNNSAPNETPDEKAMRIANAFVRNLNSPDIIGVTEVQDNNGQQPGPDDADASESYERLIEAIMAAGGPRYEYVNINPVYNADGGAPNANIRVGFLYNPERVSLVEGAPHGTATDAVGYENGKLTLNPGRIDPLNPAFENSRKPLAAQFMFNGETIVVIANHFNSKSGDTPLFGKIQPPIYGSEAQRHQIAAVVSDFVEQILRDNPRENIVVLGDLNDFEFSTTLDILKGGKLVNMIDKVPLNERYTYIYQGNSQVLDHILVTRNLERFTTVDIVHINADFTDMHGRASDHDPVLVQINLR